MIENLPRHKDFTPNLILKVKDIPEVVLRNSGTVLAKKILKMMKEVNKEAYQAKQFTRTQINKFGVLCGVVKLEHKVIDRVLTYFHKRWPQCVICLYNEYSTITSIINEEGKMWEIQKPLEEVAKKISEKREIIPAFQDIEFSGEEIFEELYKSQFIEERNNPHFFKQMIPNYCYKLPGMRKGVERKFNHKNKKLDEFLDSSK